MTQRNFHEINSSSNSMDFSEEDSQGQEVLQKSKRGRKRIHNDEGLSEADRVKKEKNREAARKCREKKEKEAKDLKTRNEELEKENKKLSDEKKVLLERAEEFTRIIQEHFRQGCHLPPDILELYNEEMESISNSKFDDAELFRAVGTIERDQTPPSTPEECSLSPLMTPGQEMATSKVKSYAPTALFSGIPLNEDDVKIRRASNTSSSSSTSSPAPPMSPSKPLTPAVSEHKDLSYYLQNKNVPQALTPVALARRQEVQNRTAQVPLKNMLPTVVTEAVEASCKSTDYTSSPFTDYNNDSRITVDPNVIEQAMMLPDISAEDDFMVPESQATPSSSSNLPSLGFSYEIAYSYQDDLQQVESLPKVIASVGKGEETGIVYSSNAQKCSSSQLESQQPSVSMSTCAPALLEISKNMTEGLQQQICSNFSLLVTATGSDVTLVTQSTNRTASSSNLEIQQLQTNKSGINQPQLLRTKDQRQQRMTRGQSLDQMQVSKEKQVVTRQSSYVSPSPLVTPLQQQVDVVPAIMSPERSDYTQVILQLLAQQLSSRQAAESSPLITAERCVSQFINVSSDAQMGSLTAFLKKDQELGCVNEQIQLQGSYVKADQTWPQQETLPQNIQYIPQTEAAEDGHVDYN